MVNKINPQTGLILHDSSRYSLRSLIHLLWKEHPKPCGSNAVGLQPFMARQNCSRSFRNVSIRCDRRPAYAVLST